MALNTGDEYRETLSDGRQVWMDGQAVEGGSVHLAFRPIVGARARIYDMAHEEGALYGT